MVCSKGEWLEITIYADSIIRDAICSFLFDLGSNTVVEPSKEDEPIISHFSININPEVLSSEIEHFLDSLIDNFPDIKRPKINIRFVQLEDYSETWKRFFKSEKVTERLLVVPPWEDVPTFEGNIMILDPGPAFGTGKHPSTRLCLREMDSISDWWRLDMLDVGAGSGILAIYGALLGARRIIAIDIDKDAIVWAKRNASLNEVEERIGFVVSSTSAIRGKYDIITANLTFEIISSIIDELIRLLEKDGHLIISGILKSQTNDIKSLLKANKLGIRSISTMDEWVCFRSKR